MNPELRELIKKYRGALAQGRVLEAVDVSQKIYIDSGKTISEPLVTAFTIAGFYQTVLKQPSPAINLFRQAISVDPDNRLAASGLILAAEEELSGRPESDSPGRIIIGLGTGRSGSSSLAELFRSQKNSRFTHEYPPRLNWAPKSPRLQFHLHRLAVLRKYHGFVGDVAHWWLPYVETILASENNIRFVVLRRNKEATIASFLRIKGFKGKDVRGAINHWVEHDGTFFRKNVWDDTYPKYDENDLPSALSRYWDNYYETCEHLQRKYPDHVRIFETERFGNVEYQQDLLNYCGFSDPDIFPSVHLNKAGSVSDGNNQV